MRILLLATLLAGCSGSSKGAAPLVSGLSLTQVAAYQVLKSTLMKDGAGVDPEAPVIEGRPLLLRAFVTPDPGWDGHEIVVRFDLTIGGQALPPVEVNKIFIAPSTDGDLESTANLELPAEQVTADLTWAISLRELRPGKAVTNYAALYPLEGQMPLGARSTGDGSQVVVIPIIYDADGSGRLPDTSDQAMEALRARMVALYPVKDATITVGAPLHWATLIEASGRGWGRLLNAVIDKRLRANVPSNVYYYGLFMPSDSFSSFCAAGCVLGLSPVSEDPNDEYARGSIGVSFPNSDSEDTFVHEVGHAHGRQHAPCDVDDPDRAYPYDDGMIGVWGYDSVAKKLIDPAGRSRDFMGYCSPSWVSDYTYRALYERISYLNASPRLLRTSARFRSIVVEDGEAVRGELVTLSPGGEAREIERVTEEGSEKVPARWYPFNHLPGGILLVPEDADTGELRFNGLTVR